MVTKVISREKLIYTPKVFGNQHIEAYGLSTDEKPMDMPNASPFMEMDTGKIFLFDEENAAWLPVE